MLKYSQSQFTFGLYGWDEAPWSALSSFDGYIKWLLTQNPIGYCDSAECEIRPRPKDMAVMFEDEDGKGWTHVPKDVWQKFLER